jgi:CPA1 family monovalent cation:H+ antiporter
MGSLGLADLLHPSGPIAAVAGFFIGHRGQQWATSETTRERLDGFWKLQMSC